MAKRGSMSAAIKAIKGTPGEERAVRAGVKAAKEALEDGKTQAQAKKIGAEVTEKRLGENRKRAGKELLNLAVTAAPGGLLALAGRTAVKTTAKAAIKKAQTKRKQSDAAAKTNKMRKEKRDAAEPTRGKKTLEAVEKGKADRKAAPAREAAKKERRRAATAAGAGIGIGAGILAGMSAIPDRKKKQDQAEEAPTKTRTLPKSEVEVAKETPTRTRTPSGRTARIKRGDTLSAIARKAGVSLKELMEANPSIKDANRIRVGQSIKIPSKSGRGTYEGMSRSEMRAISRDREDQGDTPFQKGGMVKKTNFGAMDFRKGGMVLNVTDNRRKSRG